ncbi:MAG: hypothetical protein V7K40_00075 [Nostoc sp.]|uniref:hypothetical protein n=1 Tax=Nostoc sp. TaxID=1180 RepID=UPI002FF7E2D6
MKMHLIIKRTALPCGNALGERVTLVARHRLPLGEDSLFVALTPVAYGGKPALERWFTPCTPCTPP